ncbi:UNVERIFIED_CONTAM: hypothetical protein HDU68_000105 [Siphonaria sp. JEL0065]|nr:hypothetical protein HDU68_000105 [Siphonaria sp. JEL0065]
MIRIQSFALIPIRRYTATAFTSNTPSVRVWWDSQCPLCIREITLMKQIDKSKRIEFIDIHTGDPNSAVSCPISTKSLLEKFHAQRIGPSGLSDGPVLNGAAAFGLMWRNLPPPLKWIGNAMEYSPAFLRLAERSYVFFLQKLRPSLQRFVIEYDNGKSNRH